MTATYQKPPFRHVLFCEPKFFQKFMEVEVKRGVAKATRCFGFQVITHPWCDPNKAYLCDGEGKIHTIIIEDENA